MARQMTEDQKKELEIFNAVIAKMKDDFNGCPYFDGRERGQLDDIAGKRLTIEDIYPMNDYHAIIFEELPDTVYLTGGALKDLCNEYERKYVVGRVIEIGELVKTKKGRQFRPIKIIA